MSFGIFASSNEMLRMRSVLCTFYISYFSVLRDVIRTQRGDAQTGEETK